VIAVDGPGLAGDAGIKVVEEMNRTIAEERIAGTNEELPDGFYRAGEDLPGGDIKLPQRIGLAEKRNRKTADARIAVCTELATAMGIKYIPFQDGFLFSHGDRQAYLTAGGRLEKARVQLAEQR